MIILKLLKKENEGLKIAINILLNNKIRKGDEVGFTIGRKHYIIKRDE